MIPDISLAILGAATWHRNQVDKGGHAYILHPLQVMLRVLNAGASMEAVVAAVLHDVVEDTEACVDEISILFGERVGNLVYLLTKREGEDYFAYIDRVKTDAEATAIKLADLEENLRTDRDAPPNDARRAKYEKAKAILMGEWA